MPISAPQTVTKPAEPEKQFPYLWITSLVVTAPGPSVTQDGLPGEDPVTSGRMAVDLIPMAADGSLLTTEKRSVTSDEFYRAASEVPELATAFASVLAAMPAVIAWVSARETAKAQALSEQVPE